MRYHEVPIWIFKNGIRYLLVTGFFSITGNTVFSVITKNIKDWYLPKYRLLPINTEHWQIPKIYCTGNYRRISNIGKYRKKYSMRAFLKNRKY